MFRLISYVSSIVLFIWFCFVCLFVVLVFSAVRLSDLVWLWFSRDCALRLCLFLCVVVWWFLVWLLVCLFVSVICLFACFGRCLQWVLIGLNADLWFIFGLV